MSAQSPLPNKDRSLALQVEDAVWSLNTASGRRTRFLWTGLGFTVLMMIGASCGLLFPSSSSSVSISPLGHEVASYHFAPTSSLPRAQHDQQLRGFAPSMSAEATEKSGFDDGLSRRSVLSTFASAAAATYSSPAWAGYAGEGASLGLRKTKPEDAEKDDELLATKEVKKALYNLKNYRTAAKALKAKFDKDNNLALIPIIRKEFDAGDVRDNLNVVTTIFDDETQKTIDRIDRAIIYDLNELENSSRQKASLPERTPKMVTNVNNWFAKLDLDLGELFAYFSDKDFKTVPPTTTRAPTTTPPPPPPQAVE